jgi:alkylhydroperoxidase/carboxymuconolactone decarboxylase family protein YurZ
MARVEASDPDLYSAVAACHGVTMGQGVLDPKTKLLIALAVDAYAGSTGVKGIAAAARAAGATDAEIAETLRVPYYVAGNRVLVAAVSAFE